MALTNLSVEWKLPIETGLAFTNSQTVYLAFGQIEQHAQLHDNGMFNYFMLYLVVNIACRAEPHFIEYSTVFEISTSLLVFTS